MSLSVWILLTIAILGSLVIALTCGVVAYTFDRNAEGAVKAGGVAFATSMGLCIGVIALQRG
ncbi:hypothetical protein [Streptomyces sp. NPDC048256]|uniref:hypothetical protein n=1 Tax=unclassified Streptomyces TaxID=2593676 RepID=UPI0033F28369